MKKKCKNKKFAKFAKPLLLSSIILGGGGKEFALKQRMKRLKSRRRLLRWRFPRQGRRPLPVSCTTKPEMESPVPPSPSKGALVEL